VDDKHSVYRLRLIITSINTSVHDTFEPRSQLVNEVNMSNSFILPNGKPKTVIVTGGAGGIGAQTIRSYHSAGCNVVIADLPFAKDNAEALISSLSEPERAMFHPTNIISWTDMQALFRETKKYFGQIDVVVANAGLMESKGFFDFEEDDTGELKEPTEAYKIVDVNLKGTMNSKLSYSIGCSGTNKTKALRLAMHSMSMNALDSDDSRGSVVLIASTSGYFGGTGVVSYISSKHGVVGLARASQRKATELNVRINVVAPFFTPTYITTGYSDEWKKRGLPANTVEDVAKAIVDTSMAPERRGHSLMVRFDYCTVVS
jgi:NAD(P)-dependent dehydrogenase (short-subunit alcohol dehydrogenase family)